MLSNSTINAVTCTMSQDKHSALSRKKFSKHPVAPALSTHKLLKIPSTSTYVVNDIAEDADDLLRVPSRISVPMYDFEKAYMNHGAKKYDKMTSSTNVTSRNTWDNKKAATAYMPDNVIREESEIIGVLSQQLYLAEVQMHKLQSTLNKAESQVKSKDQEIERLKRKVKDWEGKNKTLETLRKKEQEQRRRESDQSNTLYNRCLSLEQRIFEMEKFLADYGLVWVGDTGNTKTQQMTDNNYIETYYEQIAKNIEQLNLAAGKGEVKVHHNEKGCGATFKTTSCMSLKFYKNGIMVGNGRFRSYSDPTTVSFLRDILDGYYPSELQQAYPNGVPFKVEDHRNQTYFGTSAVFPGHGYRLGKQLPTDNVSLSTSFRRPSTTSTQRSARRCPLLKEVINPEFSEGHLPTTGRSSKPKTSRDALSTDMYILRSQILASHNNICSNMHIQSHLNAELNSSTKKDKRESPAKSTDSELVKERSLKSKTIRRHPSAGRCYYTSSDRITLDSSPNRFDCLVKDRPRQRSRSASLSRNYPALTSKPSNRLKLPAETKSFEISSSPYFPLSSRRVSSRLSTSALQPRKVAPPVLHQINEPSGRDGELRLKVRSLNGGTVYLVHASADDSVARLYQLLDRAMLRSVPRGYKIVLSGYSPRRLEHLTLSLRESGITRDCVLHLVND